MASPLPERVYSRNEFNLGRGLGELGDNLGAILARNLCPDDVRVAIALLTDIDSTPRVVTNFYRILLSRLPGNFALPIQLSKLVHVIVHCLSWCGASR